jgi:predicted transcriptional regulator of viral defense system
VARQTTLRDIAEIAQDQWGLITRRQAERAGIAPATLGRLTADGGVLERVTHGVYHLVGAPLPDHLDLRAGWLQLAPGTLAWERVPAQGVVSHRSAAELYGLGHLPADRHEFTLPSRRQSRLPDVRLHHRNLDDAEWISLRGMLVTRPARIAADLLAGHEDPEAVGHLIADAIRAAYDYPGTFSDSLAPLAARFGLQRGDGIGLLHWLLDLADDPDTREWTDAAEAHVHREHEQQRRHSPKAPARG